MPVPRLRRGRRRAGLRLGWIVAAVLCTVPGAAQELTLKPPHPADAPTCPEASPPAAPPTPEEGAESVRLGSAASQALILGDPARARDLLERAIELDPTSASLRYQYGRVLEDLDQPFEARAAYCRLVAMDVEGAESEDARTRLDALLDNRGPSLPEEALRSFERGVERATLGELDDAVAAFSEAIAAVPDWGEAYYDRGIVLARLARRSEAAADLRTYLELRPSAPDARAVAETIGQLETTRSGPGAGTALTLGLLVPGMGQLYSGRPGAGLTVLTLAGGAVAAALLVEEVTVRCLADVGAGAACPPDQILEEDTDRPYLIPGIAAAGAVALVGAVEAFLWARGRSGEGVTVGRAGGGEVSFTPTLGALGGGRVQVGLLRLRF